MVESIHLVRQRLIHVAGQADANDLQALFPGSGGD
jgi:hypothetical protein